MWEVFADYKMKNNIPKCKLDKNFKFHYLE